jgi:glycosyltransferase involved in cell wall biosynthesis
MRLLAITMCKNEEDIIERFVRINSRIIDSFIIYDDNSSDRTVEIIKKLIAEKFDITLVLAEKSKKYDQLCYRQNNIMNWLMRNYCEKSVDFIFPIDADEFLFESRDFICSELEKLRFYEANSYGLIPWKTFIPVYSGSYYSLPLRDVFAPIKEENMPVPKAVIPANLIYHNELRMGNHNLKGNNNEVILNFCLCHFPVRSIQQITAKILISAHKLTMKKDKGPREGHHFFKLVEFIRSKNYQFSPGDLKYIAFNYFRDGDFSQNYEFGTYNKFNEFIEDPLCYTLKSDSSFVVKALDSFLIDIIESVREKI